MTPFEAGLGPFVNMEKGDFVGRAALVGKDQRSLLHGVTCQRGTPSAGCVILDGKTPAGHITAGVPSPTLGCGVGYGRFNAPGDWVGRTLTLEMLDGSQHECEIVDLPFFDREKNIVRGIDRSIPERPML